MTTLELYFLIFLVIQFFHSLEELTNKFHKKFPPFPMNFKFFLGFEILFFAFWVLTYLSDTLAIRTTLLHFFILLMFANGLWHIIWWGIVKKYVPGLITAPFFVLTFLFYYFKILV